jgi:hypothetical protein
MRFVRIRETDDSRGHLALIIQFQPFILPKMLIECSEEIDDSGGPKAQPSIFGFLGV